MKTQRIFTALLFGTLALAAMAPIASADSHNRGNSHGHGNNSSWNGNNNGNNNSDSHNWQGQGSRGNDSRGKSSPDTWQYRQDDRSGYGGNYDRDDRGNRGSWTSGRTYYYEDPSSGRRSNYISDFKDRDGNADPSMVILQIDIRTGQQLCAYRYDNRAGHWRSWTGGVSWNNGGFDVRGAGVYGGYPSDNR